MTKDSAIVEELGAVKQELARLRGAFEALQSTVAQSAPRRPGRPDRPGLTKIEAAFEVVKQLNPTLPLEKRWAFTQSLLNTSLGIDRKASQQFLAEHQEEIDQMHEANGIDASNHLQNRGNDLEQLRELLADYEQITLRLAVVEAEALLEAAEAGVAQLSKKKSFDAVTAERTERAIALLEEAIGYEEEE